MLNVQGCWTLHEDEGTACSFATCGTGHHIMKYDIRGDEILDYNALKTSEFQNSLFIIYNMTIKKFTL